MRKDRIMRADKEGQQIIHLIVSTLNTIIKVTQEEQEWNKLINKIDWSHQEKM